MVFRRLHYPHLIGGITNVNILCPSLTADKIFVIVIDGSFVEHVEEPTIYLFSTWILVKFGIQFMLHQTFLFVISIVCIIRNTRVLRNVTLDCHKQTIVI